MTLIPRSGSAQTAQLSIPMCAYTNTAFLLEEQEEEQDKEEKEDTLPSNKFFFCSLRTSTLCELKQDPGRPLFTARVVSPLGGDDVTGICPGNVPLYGRGKCFCIANSKR